MDAKSLPPRALLNAFDIISQRTTWAPSDEYAAERQMECGQACVTMVLRHCSGVWFPAAYGHDLVHPKGSTEGTTIPEMQELLTINSTHSHVVQPDNKAEFVRTIKQAIAAKHPVIALRYWQNPGNPLQHYCVAIGYTPDLIQWAGPWSGLAFAEEYDWAWQMNAGYLIVVDRHRMLGDHD